MRVGYSYLLFGAMLYLMIVSQTSAQCLCAEKGLDYCSCKDPIPPAPKLIQRLKAAKFPPIGDSCWCSKQLVEPAIPPKPICNTPAKCNCKCDSPPPPPPSCFDALRPPKVFPVGVPADPVSISLALSAGRALAVPEGKLSYGPMQTPLNALEKIYISNIPEEKLYGLNSEVIELKKRIAKPEIIEEPEEEEEAEIAPVAPFLSYQQLGYGPAKFLNPLFVRAAPYAPAAPPCAAPAKPLTGCGYIPGKIIQSAKLVQEHYPFKLDCL